MSLYHALYVSLSHTISIYHIMSLYHTRYVSISHTMSIYHIMSLYHTRYVSLSHTMSIYHTMSLYHTRYVSLSHTMCIWLILCLSLSRCLSLCLSYFFLYTHMRRRLISANDIRTSNLKHYFHSFHSKNTFSISLFSSIPYRKMFNLSGVERVSFVKLWRTVKNSKVKCDNHLTIQATHCHRQISRRNRLLKSLCNIKALKWSNTSRVYFT